MVALSRNVKSFVFHMISRNSKVVVGICAVILLWLYLRQLTSPVHTEYDKIVKDKPNLMKGDNAFGPQSPDLYKRAKKRPSLNRDETRNRLHGDKQEQTHFTLLPPESPFKNVKKPETKWNEVEDNMENIEKKWNKDKEIIVEKKDNQKKPVVTETPANKDQKMQIAPPSNNLEQNQAKPEVVAKQEPIKFEPVTQELIDYMADYLGISAEIITNVEEEYTSMIQFTIDNDGSKPIPPAKWQIYFHSMRPLQHKLLPYDNGTVIPGSGLRLFLVDGYLHRLEPDPYSYKPFQAKTSIALPLTAKYHLISRTDFFPNWYVVADGFKPKVIKVTEGEDLKFVQSIDSAAKWKRSKEDKFNPYLPEIRFNLNVDSKDMGGAGNMFVPTPVRVELHPSKTIILNRKQWKIVDSVDFVEEVKFMAGLFKLQVIPKSDGEQNYIQFDKATPKALPQTDTDNEAYSLSISPDETVIKISAGSNPGAFYAVVTLFKLSNDSADGRQIPTGVIFDKPRYSYRGVHLDVARNFQSKESIMRLVDIMAMYKLNKLHLHLSDDEGWRLEIAGLPELTQLSANRCHRDGTTDCLWPQLGSPPESKLPGSGYYTIGDYKEILMYAKKHHVQVIPEIDLPGHARAAILAMESRFKKFMKQGNTEEAVKYLISDMKDSSGFQSIQGFKNNAFNPCQESSFVFLRHVMKAVKEMHKDIQPLSLFHFGGDEVSKLSWFHSTVCQKSKLVQNINITSPDNVTESWKEFFFSQIMKMAEEEQLSLGAWEDGLMNQNTKDPFNKMRFTDSKLPTFGYPWSNQWEYGKGDRAYRLANADYKVVMSQATHLYFDMAYEPDPEERGLYWATRFIDTKKTWSFLPDHLFWNADFSRNGDPLTKDQVCGENQTCVKLQRPENVVGMECHLWGELVRKEEYIDFMLFPRLLAMAERAWHKASWEDTSDFLTQRSQMKKAWSVFSNVVGYKELPFLDSKKKQYRVPVPGAEVRDGRLFVNSAFPGLEVQFSKDVGISWSNAQQAPPVKHGETIHLRTMSADKSRFSRIIKLKHDENKKDVIAQPVTPHAGRFDIISQGNEPIVKGNVVNIDTQNNNLERRARNIGQIQQGNVPQGAVNGQPQIQQANGQSMFKKAQPPQVDIQSQGQGRHQVPLGQSRSQVLDRSQVESKLPGDQQGQGNPIKAHLQQAGNRLLGNQLQGQGRQVQDNIRQAKGQSAFERALPQEVNLKSQFKNQIQQGVGQVQDGLHQAENKLMQIQKHRQGQFVQDPLAQSKFQQGAHMNQLPQANQGSESKIFRQPNKAGIGRINIIPHHQNRDFMKEGAGKLHRNEERERRVIDKVLQNETGDNTDNLKQQDVFRRSRRSNRKKQQGS